MERKEIRNDSTARHRKEDPEYLYQHWTELSDLAVFCIPRKQLKTYEFTFKFPGGLGFYHVENSFYFGGGVLGAKYFTEFRKINPDGKLTELRNMFNPKSHFPITAESQRGSLFTLGGWDGSPFK